MTVEIRELAVVIPSHNEGALLPRCLDAVAAAAELVLYRSPAVRISVTVVLDRCTDGSADIVQRSALAEGITCRAGKVGAARKLGIAHALRTARPPASQIWIANTDADSVVPLSWLHQQLLLAEQGWDVVVGTVEPDPGDLTARQLRRWHAAHLLTEEHPHIHGANLGLRADTYGTLGGFPEVAVHEDRDLVAAARAAGMKVKATDACRVLTSGRTRSTVAGGFATYLAAGGMEALAASAAHN